MVTVAKGAMLLLIAVELDEMLRDELLILLLELRLLETGAELAVVVPHTLPETVGVSSEPPLVRP